MKISRGNKPNLNNYDAVLQLHLAPVKLMQLLASF
jgi:hypothetical protein